MTCPWDSLEPAFLLSCEEPVCAWIKQPSNTYSNLGFFVVALLLWWRSRGVSRERRPHEIPLAWLSVLVGIASVVAHASLARWFAVLDFTAIFVLFSYIITANWAEISGWSAGRRHAVAWGLSLLSVAPQFYGQRTGVLVFMLYLFGCLTSEVLALKRLQLRPLRRRYLGLSLALLTIGLVCFFLDERRLVCTPSDHIFQLHSAWHLCAAASLYFLALYFEFRSGTRVESRPKPGPA